MSEAAFDPRFAKNPDGFEKVVIHEVSQDGSFYDLLQPMTFTGVDGKPVIVAEGEPNDRKGELPALGDVQINRLADGQFELQPVKTNRRKKVVIALAGTAVSGAIAGAVLYVKRHKKD